MLNTIMTIIIFIIILLFANVSFILANADRIFKEDVSMENNIIEITPDKNGKLFITLYGTRYEIVVKRTKNSN